MNLRLTRRALIVATLLASAGALIGGTAAADDAAPAAPQSPAATKDVVDKVQAFYDKSTSFKADFTQEFTATLHNKKTSSTGTVVFQKPGKMSWRYNEPAGNRIVSNGSRIRVFEIGNKQMYEQPVDKTQYPAALSFLTGTGKLTDTFNFQLFNGADMKFPGGFVLVGEPKTPTPAYKKVLFYVDGATYQVRRVLILDNQGSKNRFDFSKPRINDPVPPGEFEFEPPAGTTVIKP